MGEGGDQPARVLAKGLESGAASRSRKDCQIRVPGKAEVRKQEEPVKFQMDGAEPRSKSLELSRDKI